MTGVHSPIPAYSLSGGRDNAARDLYRTTLNLEELIAPPPLSSLLCSFDLRSLSVSIYMHPLVYS